MADCPLLEKCIFFNDKMANMPMTASLMKRDFCKGDNTKCARYMVFAALGREHVPADLFPAASETAKDIIVNKKGDIKKDLK
jgi:hypothetical protein